jgi:hypothetical protein
VKREPRTQRISSRENKGDAVGLETPGDEGKGGQRILVKPRRVIDRNEQWCLSLRISEEGENGQSHQETIDRWRAVLTERFSNRNPLQLWQQVYAIHEGKNDTMQCCVVQLELGLNPFNANDNEVLGEAG